MNKDQKFTPKYWVVHDKKIDDVLLWTASKSMQGAVDNWVNNTCIVCDVSCTEAMELWHSEEYEDFVPVLIEVRVVDLGEEHYE